MGSKSVVGGHVLKGPTGLGHNPHSQVSTQLSMRCEPSLFITGRNIMCRRTKFTLRTMVLLGLAIATALPQIAFAQTDPFLGTWQLNLAKSKYSPGPPPKSQTVNVQAEGQAQRVTIAGVAASGNPFNYTLTAVFDGLPHPTENNPNQDAYAATRVDAYTQIFSDLKADKLVGTTTIVVSPDGKTTTATAIILDGNGRPINNISVYDKQ
jgi:hypothetical protein